MKTSKYIISLVLAVWCALGNLYAVDQSYYTSVNGKSGKDLFDAVHTVSKTGYVGLGYDDLWTVYCAIDLNSSGKVWDMYSGVTSYTCGGSAQGANYSKEGDSYNREHSIPKSWFGQSKAASKSPGTDLFHVVPTDGYVNNQRSAYAFGEVSSASYTSQSGCKKGSPKSITISNSILNKSGSSTQSCSASTVFEPMDEFKGDFARGYFGTMIKWANGDYQTFTTAEGAQIFNTAYTADKYYGLTGYGVALLLKWHREDPVSQKEIDRNNGIQNQQGNRNPFIDYPELVEYIWGEHSGETVTLSSLTPTFDGGFTPVTPTTYTVVLSRNGQLESITGVSGTYNLPASSDAACDGWTFAGWSATKVTSTISQPSFITSVNAGGTVYAVYSKTTTPAPHRAKMADTEVTFTPGTDTGETSVTKNNVTCTMTTMSNGSYYQIYANQSGTFSCSAGNITKIEFTCTASGTSKYGPGNASADVGTYSYSGSKGTWTGSASSVTISSTAQVRMSSLTVTYSGSGGGGGSTTYDSEPEDCQCSGQFAAPTVNATASDKTITLTWADISGATNGYIVYVGTGVGYTTECADPEIGSITNSNGNNTCEITGLVNGLEYTASVVANATATTCEGIAGTATATPIGCQAWADPTFTYATTTLNVGGGKVSPNITGTTYGTPTFTSSNTSVLTVDEDGKISPVSAGTATVTAHWPGDGTHCPKDVVSNTITVKGTVVLTFNANDGSDNPATKTQNFTYGEAQNLTANSFSRTGYTFQGWATSPSGSKEYDNGASITITAATTLYAVWQANKHNVTFTQPESGGTFTVNGSNSSPVSNVDFGSTVTIVVTPTNSHFTVGTVTVSGTSGSIQVSGSGNTRTFTMPDEDVTVAVTMNEDPKYTVNWYVSGTATPETNYAGSTLAGIANPSIDCNGKTFQGWTATANYSSDDAAPNDLFTDASTKSMPSNNNTNYYAVFATVETTTGSGSEGWLETAITDLTSSDVFVIVGDDYALPNDATSASPKVASVTISQGEITSTISNELKWNISGNSTDGYTFYPNGSTTTWLYCNTTADSKNNDNIRVGTGDRKAWKINNDGYLITKDNYVDRYLSIYTTNGSAVDFRGYINTTNGAFEAKYYKYNAGSSSTTTISGYTTTCVACESKVTITKGTPSNGSFNIDKTGEQDNCSSDGLVVTVTDITPDEGYRFKEITQTGINSGVTINNTAKTVTYAQDVTGASTINVVFEALPTYTIRFYNNGALVGSAQIVTEGQSAVKPSTDPTTCDEKYTFFGWWTAELDADNTTAETWITDFTATKDQDYYAVYRYTETSGGSSSTPVTKTMSTFTAVSGNVDGDENISYVAAQGEAATAPAINSGEIRIYQNGGTLTITANNSKKITAVTIGSSMATSVTYAINGGSASDDQDISAGETLSLSGLNASSILFTCTGTDKNHRLYLNYLSVTYSDGGSGTTTTYYTTAPDCEAPIVTSAKMLVAEYGGARVALMHDNTNTVAALPLMYFGGNYFIPNIDKNGSTASAPEKETLTWQVAERTDGYYIKSDDNKFLAQTEGEFALDKEKFLWPKQGALRLAYDADIESFVVAAGEQGDLLPGITPVDVPGSISLTELNSPRDLTIGRFGTICLPHAVALPFTWGVKVYSIEGAKMTDDKLVGIYMVEETEMLTAGKPYLIEALTEKMNMWYATGAPTADKAVEAKGLVGNLGEEFCIDPTQSDYYYVLSNNQLRRVGENAKVKVGQYKAYFDLEGLSEPATMPQAYAFKVMYVENNEQVETDLNEVPVTINWDEPVYNILGMRVDRNATGVLIQGGTKFIIRVP